MGPLREMSEKTKGEAKLREKDCDNVSTHVEISNYISSLT